MMNDAIFYYRIPGRAGGYRPGAHAGRTAGTGLEFKSHVRLLDCPDPRRLDLRASLRGGRDEWLVRLYRQRAAVPVYAVVDVSASMEIGTPRRKLDVAATFVEVMGNSAFKVGDPAGLCAFDSGPREDLYVPARHSRGAGQVMASRIARSGRASTYSQRCGLVPALQALAGRPGLVFLVSDFHWPLKEMATALDLLERSWVVPIVIWDSSEVSPPDTTGFVRLRDAESGQVRPLWLTSALRERWKARIAARRQELENLFASRRLRPIFITGAFSTDALSQYFIESLS
jgi:uncharacterized protein (DUF58 family)